MQINLKQTNKQTQNWVAFPPCLEPAGIPFPPRIKLLTLYYAISVGVIGVESLLYDFMFYSVA